ncbi:hypothetical protein EGW08_022178, partial [Elysia chlorotica]
MPSNNHRNISPYKKNSESDVFLLKRTYSSSESSADSESKRRRSTECSSDSNDEGVFFSVSETGVKIPRQNPIDSNGYATVIEEARHHQAQPGMAFRGSVRSASTAASTEGYTTNRRVIHAIKESPHWESDFQNTNGILHFQNTRSQFEDQHTMEYITPMDLIVSGERPVSHDQARPPAPPRPHRFKHRIAQRPPHLPRPYRIQHAPNVRCPDDYLTLFSASTPDQSPLPHRPNTPNQPSLPYPPIPPTHCCLQPKVLLVVTGVSLFVAASCLALFCVSVVKLSAHDAQGEICLPCMKLLQNSDQVRSLLIQGLLVLKKI